MSDGSSNELDLIKIALRHKLVIGFGLCAGVGVGHLVYHQLGPEYVATGKILVAKQATVHLKGGEASDSSGRAEHVPLIMSPLIVEKAVQIGQLQQLPSMQRSKDIVEDIVEDLKVQRSAGQDSSVLNVLDITYKNRNRADAMKVVDAIVRAYDDFLGELHRKRTTDLLGLVDQANGNLRAQVEDKEREYEKFRQTAPIHLKPPVRGPNGERVTIPTNVHEENLQALDKERQQVLLRKAELQSQIQSIETSLAAGQPREVLAASIQLFDPTVRLPNDPVAQAGPTPLAGAPNPAARPEATQLEAQWMSVKLQEEQLLLTYGADWPGVQAVRRQLALIEWQFRQKKIPLPYEAAAPAVPLAGIAPGITQPLSKQIDLVSLYVTNLRQQLDALGRREVEIDAVYQREFKNAQELAQFVERDRRMNEDIDRLNGLWNVVRNQAAQIDLVKDNREYTLQPISPVRDQLSLKRLLKLYGLGVGGVMSLVGAFVFWNERRRNQLGAVSSLAPTVPVRLALPVATPVSVASESRSLGTTKAFVPPFTRLGAIPEFAVSTGRRKDNAPFENSLCVYHRADSAEAAAFGRLAAAVRAPAERFIVGVTAPTTGQGASTVAANLAIALANAGQRVLLLDAHLQQPSQHKLFGFRNDVGLTEVLANEVDLMTGARQTQIQNLHVLPAGAQAGVSELLLSPLEALLTEARREFDAVVIDLPPVVGSKDSRELSRVVDGSLFVWKSDATLIEVGNFAVDVLRQGGRVLGAVANCDIETTLNSGRTGQRATPIDPAVLASMS